MRTDAEWGGNFELAAAVRCFKVHIIVHQFAAPRYQLTNHERSRCRTVHVSYHDGEHFNSVRILGDEATEGAALEAPSVLKINVESSPSESKCGKPSDTIVLSRATGCSEDAAVAVLADCDGDVDAAIEVLLSIGDVGDEESSESPDTHSTSGADIGWESASFAPKPKKRATTKAQGQAKRLRENKAALHGLWRAEDAGGGGGD